MKKIVVGILCGGRSSEHEISCISAGGILAAIDRELYQPIVIGITKTAGRWVLIPAEYPLSIVDGVLPTVPENGMKVDTDIAGLSVDGKALHLDLIFPMLHGPYGEDGSIFAEHPPTPSHLAGIEAATGSLGHGMPMGLGMAMAARIQQQSYNVIALMSDGECNEGSIWEAAMLAASQKVERLVAIIDFNKWQATGRSEEVLALNPLADKWRAFGWDAHEVDGHDMKALVDLLSKVPNGSGKPIAIVAHTVKGKGVSFMEDDNNWHYRIPTAEEVVLAKKELGVAA